MDQMEQVRRIYAVKRPGFDVEAQALLRDLRDQLDVVTLQSVRIYNRYDLSGVSDATYAAARATVFADLPVDELIDESVAWPDDAFVLAVEALPGQYDQRADAAAQCVQVLTNGVRPLCLTARVYCLQGALDEEQRARIRNYLINPVESREASLDKPATLEQVMEAPAAIPTLDGFREMDDAALQALLGELGLAMTLADLRFCQPAFRQEGRDPTMTEIRVLDTYWSDHCRHTTFLTQLEDVQIAGDGPMAEHMRTVYARYLAARTQLYGAQEQTRPICLMDLATLAAKEMHAAGQLPRLDLSEEVNACSVRTRVRASGREQEQDYYILFKNETHNHPTEIEPFGGAATCLGGAIRDPLSGRAYVYQSMRVTGSGDPTVPVTATIPGKLWQRKITTTAAAGFSAYGNEIGLAAGQVEELYHPGYVAKRMEVGAVIAAAPAANVVRERPQPGDVVVLLGGRTGRDGCGGATGSSRQHDESSLFRCGSEVQKGNPVTERKIQRLFRDPEVSRLIRRCNDFGAGGVAVAIGELADGLDIDLDAVPRKYAGLDGTELAISESQERMAVVLDPADAPRFIAAAAAENLEAVVVAHVTAEPRMIIRWRGQEIVNLPRAFLDTNGAPQYATAHVQAPSVAAVWPAPAADDRPFASRLRMELATLTNASRQGLAGRFDATSGAGTVLMPFGGARQASPEEGMAAKIPVLDGETEDCTLMAHGFDPYLSERSPYHGAYYAVAESVARITAMGGDPSDVYLSFQEYFERLRGARSWGKPLAALLGAYQAQHDLGLASIGGKDSMSGTFNDLHVPPTLISFAVGFAEADHVVSAALPGPDHAVYLLRAPRTARGLPAPAALVDALQTTHALIRQGRVTACATVRTGGVAVALAQMCFGNAVGFQFDASWSSDDLFCDDRAALLVAVARQDQESARILIDTGARVVGYSTTDATLVAQDSRLKLADAYAAWRAPLAAVFPDTEPPDDPDTMTITPRWVDGPRIRRTAAWVKTKPLALIPVFPGSSSEYETAYAVEKAGGRAEVLVIRNLEPRGLAASMAALGEALARAQILLLPGGFSVGDEPDGAGKFGAAALRDGRLAEEIERLLYVRDGLALGVGNGFQTLVKLGLLPFGHIAPATAQSPTLTINRIGRHVSLYARTRVTSNLSPWLALTQPDEEHMVVISHGEGRFVADAQLLQQMAANGQIVTQYVDADGHPARNYPANPSGSVAAIEGICSPDGRILGKMAHSERVGTHVARNIPGAKDQQIFAAGLRYFRM